MIRVLTKNHLNTRMPDIKMMSIMLSLMILNIVCVHEEEKVDFMIQ